MRIAALTALILSLAACASAERDWNHPTATAAQFENDQAHCRNEGLLTIGERSELPMDADAFGFARERAYEDCMAALGYRFGA
ncbi:hypothetical protein [Minwuia thermotolerans]|uniref:Lipoprotein n=1 Tax=Minwuia thermotolerans TaxID=2056226 RepID=A0A2M9FXJ1_9PROT|nr:hypothetical protein [Minwuia thermotolerans]PJK28181.1 hypothetical protein CVT23_17535 [Minwuia thermotolerans]